MGIIRAGLGAVGGVLADQWKDFFYCDAMPANVLVQRGQKKGGKRNAGDNVISNGSGIAVADGQCMIIVDQGKVVDICAEPGEYQYDMSSEPSIFFGDLGESIKASFKNIGARFAMGGIAGKEQRVYYFNTKEIVGNKFGTPNPVPFRVVDRNIKLDMDISIRCNGEYSYRLIDPILFYTNVCGNVDRDYERSNLESMLKAELLTALQPAFAKISEMGIRYSALPGHAPELAAALNEVLSVKWTQARGIAMASVGINSATASEDDEDMIKQLQKSAVMRDPGMAAAVLTGAQADALRKAAGNEAGAMTGFLGMNMVQQSGGSGVRDLFAMSEAQQAQAQQQGQGGQGAPGSWRCTCGAVGQGKFCAECGRPRSNICKKCGWQAGETAPKFCPECGERFELQ
jgi:membrane protease subunit (stomatin/prohibitin family)